MLIDLDCIIKKSTINAEIPIYMATSKELIPGYNIFYIDAEEALKDIKYNVNIYKINFKDMIKCAAFTNIVYFDNTNQTLPIGMNISTGILIDTSRIKMKLKAQETNYVIKNINNKIVSRKVKIFEYEA